MDQSKKTESAESIISSRYTSDELSAPEYTHRLYAIVFIAVLPLFLLLIFNTVRERDNAIKNAKQEMLILADVLAFEQERIFRETPYLLTALSKIPIITSNDSLLCRDLFSSLIKSYPQYVNFGIMSVNGEVWCSGNNTNIENIYKSNTLTQKIIGTKKYSISEFIKTNNGSFILSFGQPIFKNGELSDIIFAELDLMWFISFIKSVNPSSGLTVAIFSESGIILYDTATKETPGGSVANSKFGDLVLGGSRGSAVVEGPDGESRVYAYFPFIQAEGAPVAYLSIGVPNKLLFTVLNRTFVIQLLIITLLGLSVMLATRAIGNRLLIQHIKALQGLNRLKGDFVSLVSHQLRTPLSYMGWFAQMLSTGEVGKLNKTQQKYTGAIVHGTERMVELVRTFLNASRLETGKMELAPKEIHLNEFVKKTVSDCKYILEKTKCSLRFEPKKGYEPTLFLDPTLFHELLVNLVANAVRYSKPNETNDIVIKIESGSNGMVELSIVDEGIGISENDRKSLFKKFFRAENARRVATTGTGLGLYLCGLIINEFKGKIWFESTEGVGTTFFISLPLNNRKSPEILKK